MAWQRFCLALLIVLDVASHTSAVDLSNGAPECPCLSTASDGFAEASASLQIRGFPADYGFTGCAMHDAGVAQTSCDGDEPRPGHCSAKWCYVDPATCQVDSDECQLLGMKNNAPDHPSCRSRPFSLSNGHPDVQLFYSYETCGYLNNYEIENVFASMQNTMLVGAATHDLPYVSVQTVKDVSDPTQDTVSYSGIEYTFVGQVLEHFVSSEVTIPPTLRMIDGWATEHSRSRFNSSYTACVNDVAVGNFDICIGDFWMTMFLPSMRSDTFFLVVFEDTQSVSFKDFIQNPFMPFSNEAWAIIAAVVALKALTMAILDYDAEDNERDANLSPQRRYFQRWWRSFFFAWVSVFSGKSHFRSQLLGAQVATMAFQIFALVVVASYKAKLASMLIVQNIGGGVSSIDEAILEGYTICIPEAIESTIKINYQAGRFEAYSGSSRNFARLMHSGLCDAAVIHRKRIEEMHAGWIKQADCDEFKAAGETGAAEEEFRCSTSTRTGERDDCKIMKVGEEILTVPIAFPITSGRLVTPMSVAVTKAQNAGEWEKSKTLNKDLMPNTMCDEELGSGRLGMEAFAGVSFIVGLGVVLGLAIRYAQHEMRVREERGGGGGSKGSSAQETPSSEASQAQPKAILEKLAEVTSLVRQLEAERDAGFHLSCDSGVVHGSEFVAAGPGSGAFTSTVPRGGGSGTWPREGAAGSNGAAESRAGFSSRH